MGNSKKAIIVAETARQLYEASVIERMDGRCGVTPKGAKGIALEIMDKDQLNLKDSLNPSKCTQLVKNPHAKQVDAITMKNKRPEKRIQYKDTFCSIDNTISQVKSGKYNQVTLRGTTETAKAFNDKAKKTGINKKMESTGISTDTTKRVGDKYCAVKKGKVSSEIGRNICNASKTAATNSAGIIAVEQVIESVSRGEDIGTCANKVTSKSAEALLTGGSSGLMGELVGTTMALINPSLAIPAALLTEVATASVVGEMVEGAFDEVGYVVEDAVDNVVTGVCDIIDEIGGFFCGFFI